MLYLLILFRLFNINVCVRRAYNLSENTVFLLRAKLKFKKQAVVPKTQTSVIGGLKRAKWVFVMLRIFIVMKLKLTKKQMNMLLTKHLLPSTNKLVMKGKTFNYLSDNK